MRHAILPALLALVFVPSVAQACRVLHPALQPGERVAWTAACRDGLADGPGVLSIARPGKPGVLYEVTMARGEIVGDGIMRVEGDIVYAGTFRQGQPHGPGFFRYPDGAKYEGGVANGQPEGQGTWTSKEGTRYTGQWHAGKKHGRGRVDYALGGSYEGEWADDTYHGRGVLTYAGSGRQVEGEFRNGLLAGAPPPVPVAPSNERYVLKEEMPRTGTSLLRDIVVSPFPLDKRYADLTPAQQAAVRAPYKALAAGDEPPFPLNGSKQMLAAIGKALAHIGARGELILLVRVGADGVAQSVTAVGAPTPELVQFASSIVMLQKYKPAVCDGKPCEMIYPVALQFDMRH